MVNLRYVSTLVALAVCFVPEWVKGTSYTLDDEIVGYKFYHAFEWQSIVDPTHGRVQYVDMATSIRHNLTYATKDTFVLRGDYQKTLPPSGPGRMSARIMSKQVYKKHVVVVDLRHMPQGCGTWPAIWETAIGNWPNDGEVDIVEGVNNMVPNAAALHTGPGCVMPPQEGRTHTGTAGQLECDAAVNHNTGCTVKFPSSPPSFGPPFNANGGGWFAMERSDEEGIKIWFWAREPRHDHGHGGGHHRRTEVSGHGGNGVPRDVKFGGRRVDPKSWVSPILYPSRPLFTIVV
ncbi:hypothetical protein EST38_g4019 [Candolleomyces aberdarensis]|uniref:GH16 domain-containing protein n=1 Tax=Candolleomyces aberdarensis TaxID=2316362 RepID=A0A4Q2DSG6_9AGAR|nr:hypothetical protein EST38_g4019 [Candolleomyces aberdarensis]